jgi:DNA-directed RNA polymerase alpha subunit
MNNPPAFPDGLGNRGMSLRDYFATHAMQSLLLDAKNLFLKQSDVPPILFRSVEELEISFRATRCLVNDNLLLIGDVIQCTEKYLLSVKNMGKTSVEEIKSALHSRDLYLGSKISGWRKVSYDEVAIKAYEMADEMLKAR